LTHLSAGLRESALLAVCLLAIFLLASLMSFDPGDPGWSRTGANLRVQNLGGVTGAWLADLLLYFVGYPAFLLPPLVATAGWLACRQKGGRQFLRERTLSVRVIGLLLTLLASCGLASVLLSTDTLPNGAGGVLGNTTSQMLLSAANLFGAALVMIGLLLVGCNLCTGLSWGTLVEYLGRYTMMGLTALQGAASALVIRLRRMVESRPRPTMKTDFSELIEGQRAPDLPAGRHEPIMASAALGPLQAPTPQRSILPAEPSATKSRKPKRQKPGTATGKQFEMSLPGLPGLDLLDGPSDVVSGYAPEVLEALSSRVELELADFGIQVKVVGVLPGPVITRFELQPAPGIKVSQISNLAKDIARGLSVIAVRVVDVIPGKSVIGLEIPNVNRQIVYLGEVLRSDVYQNSDAPLTLVLGEDISGNSAVADLAKMPHLLVAGTTGSGKSVALNTMLLSILYKSTPEEARLILIDPKMLELSVYEGIPHLLAPVVTDMQDAASALRWCVAEMERRYKLMAELRVRNIAGFNKRVREAASAGEPITDPFFVADPLSETEEEPPVLQTLPFVVVVIDELADLMLVVGKKIEELIARLAQKARASGIHLILATQRPSVDVITGLIKANIPTRIAFQVSSKIDSRTIIDQMGAETLLGHGDMLFLPPGTGFPQRLHGAFVDDHEVHRVVDRLKQMGAPDYIEGILDEDMDASLGAMATIEVGDAEEDPLYDQAVQIVTETRRASASGIQRRLKIGYNRAARLIEAMEQAGIVSTQGSNGMREVLAHPPPES
jgi:S-DNA-T family DNA segregation ATPase FtsK/SpoIIIE